MVKPWASRNKPPVAVTMLSLPTKPVTVPKPIISPRLTTVPNPTPKLVTVKTAVTLLSAIVPRLVKPLAASSEGVRTMGGISCVDSTGKSRAVSERSRGAQQ